MTHSGVKPYKCVFCEKAFTQRGNLQHHMFLHTEKKPFSCEECGKSFAQKGNLKSHQASVHSSAEKLYTCSVCGHSFAFQGSLKNHQEKVHNSKLPKINNVMLTNNWTNKIKNSERLYFKRTLIHSITCNLIS